VWDCKYFDDTESDTNPMNNVLVYTQQPLYDDFLNPVLDANGVQKIGRRPTPDTLVYFSKMSRAFATLCSGKFYSLHKDVAGISSVGIFATVELKCLQQKMGRGMCSSVTQVRASPAHLILLTFLTDIRYILLSSVRSQR
jgi:hypothetical protein